MALLRFVIFQLLSAASAETQWKQTWPLITPRATRAAAVFNSKLFLLGGIQNETGTALKTVEMFDGSGWSAAPSMLESRYGLSAVVFKSRLYAIGGTDNKVEVFDGRSWSPAPPTTWMYDNGAAAVVFNSRLYALGGGGTLPGGGVEVFDGTSWSSAPFMLQRRCQFAAVAFKSKLYAMGGSVYGGLRVMEGFVSATQSSVEVFDGTSWSPAPSMLARREGHAAAVFDSKLFVVGGWIPQDSSPSAAPSNSVEFFDGTSWSFGPSMVNARLSFAAAVFDSKLFAIGGKAGASWNRYLDAVEVLYGSADNSKVHNVANGTSVVGRAAHLAPLAEPVAV